MGRSDTVTVTVTPPPKRKSILKITGVYPQSGPSPLEVYVYGQLLDQDGITPLPNRTVKIAVNDSVVGSATTSTNGNVTFTLTLTDVGTYSIYLTWDGDEYYEGCD